MGRWRLVVDPAGGSGAWNMAADEALFRAAEEGLTNGPVLRLYAWDPPCLSIGYHQRLGDTCDERYCARAGFEVVRRPTGGKAVLHDEEVTYSVTGRQDLAPFCGLSLMDTYGLIAQALAAGLRTLGLHASCTRRGRPISPEGGSPCFLLPSEKEITVEGRKVVGSAQRRGERAFLQHGAIPLRLDYEALALASGQPVADAASYRDAFAGVSDFRPGITREVLAQAIAEGFAAVFPGPWERRPLDEHERNLAKHLVEERYGTAEWTMRGPQRSGSEGEGDRETGLGD